MIGHKIRFKNPDSKPCNRTEEPIELDGTVLDKIDGTQGYVARGYAISNGSNNVAVQNSFTYYLVANVNGKIYTVYPSALIKTYSI